MIRLQGDCYTEHELLRVNTMREKTRKIKLLVYLSELDGYKPASYFSKKLNVSGKTIYNDVQEINQSLEGYDFSINMMPRHGISLVGNPESIKKYIAAQKEDKFSVEPYTTLDRQLEMMKMLVLKNEKVSYDELATKFLVSQTSIRNDIEKLKKYFKSSKAQIASDNSGTYVTGDEGSIQKTYKRFIFNVLKNETGKSLNNLADTKHLVAKIFDEKMIDFVSDIVPRIVNKRKRMISDDYISSLYISLLTLLTRVHLDQHVKRDKDFVFKNIKYMELYMIGLEVSSEASKTLGIVLVEEDIEYLSEILFAHGIEPINVGNLPDEKFTSAVKEMIAKSSEILKTDLTSDKKLYDSLLFHVIPMVYRLVNGHTIKNPLLEGIKKQYMVMFSITWYAASVFERRFNVLLTDDEVAFLAVHLQVAFDRKYKPKNILIVCPIGLSTSELAFNKIRQIIPSLDNLETASVEQVYTNDLSDVDFIIALTKLEDIGKKVIQVSPLVTPEEIQEISDYYLRLNQNINSLRNTEKSKGKQIKKYISEKLLFMNKEFKTKEECINFFSSQYEKANIVTSEFRASIYNRENVGATSINTGVAIPHAALNTVLETKIGIMTLKKPVMWNGVEVRVVIMLAVAEVDAHEFKEMMGNIYDAIDTNEKVLQIANTKNKEELMKLWR